MINGAHIIIESTDAEADRVFFRDVLHFPHVDAGHGWLIFALPPAEAAFHPGAENNNHALYLMCDDLKSVIETLKTKKIACGKVIEERWGTVTTIRLPGGGDLGLYQPKHPKAIGNH